MRSELLKVCWVAGSRWRSSRRVGLRVQQTSAENDQPTPSRTDDTDTPQTAGRTAADTGLELTRFLQT